MSGGVTVVEQKEFHDFPRHLYLFLIGGQLSATPSYGYKPLVHTHLYIQLFHFIYLWKCF